MLDEALKLYSETFLACTNENSKDSSPLFLVKVKLHPSFSFKLVVQCMGRLLILNVQIPTLKLSPFQTQSMLVAGEWQQDASV